MNRSPAVVSGFTVDQQVFDLVAVTVSGNADSIAIGDSHFNRVSTAAWASTTIRRRVKRRS